MRVKICGITREEDVISSAEAGADALGFVCGYQDSPRNLSLEKVKELVKLVPPYSNSVVVTPLSNPEIFRIVEEAHPSLLQLSGSKKDIAVVERLVEKFKYDKIIQTIHVQGELSNLINEGKELAKISKAILLDSKGDGNSIAGGSGKVHDWNLSAKIREEISPVPVILGGGLSPVNVSSAIRAVNPYAVDVSSGVESQPGIKSTVKVKEFINNAKNSPKE